MGQKTERAVHSGVGLSSPVIACLWECRVCPGNGSQRLSAGFFQLLVRDLGQGKESPQALAGNYFPNKISNSCLFIGAQLITILLFLPFAILVFFSAAPSAVFSSKSSCLNLSKASFLLDISSWSFVSYLTKPDSSLHNVFHLVLLFLPCQGARLTVEDRKLDLIHIWASGSQTYLVGENRQIITAHKLPKSTESVAVR